MGVPVSLVCVDCQYPQLAQRAMATSLDQFGFAAARLLTSESQALALRDPRIEVVEIPRVASAAEYSRFMLKELLHHVATDYVQVIQWDGFVVRGAAWRNEFLEWDYIGARWWFRPEGRNVGNGGFSLRSRRLLRALQDPDISLTDNEDSVIGFHARELLEKRHGIRFAPGAVADRYAFEGTYPTQQEFGFHRISNLPYVMGAEEMAALLGAVSDATLCGEAAVDLVAILASQGRREEALHYARRVRSFESGYLELPARLRHDFEQLVQRLEPE